MNRRIMTACIRGVALTVSAAALLVHAAPALAQNLHVSGKVGIASSSPNLPLHVATCSTPAGDCVARDVSLTQGGFAMFGQQTDSNLAFDDNEIMARKNSKAGNLYINADGGNIFLGSEVGAYTKIGSGATGTTGAARLVIEGGSDIALADPLGEGVVQVGRTAGPHLIIDNDEIMTRLGQNGGAILALNDFSGGLIRIGGAAPISDASLKADVEPVRNALEKLGALRGVTWRWKDSHGGPARSMGVIAQEIERVFPDIVVTDPRDGLKAVQYDALVGPLIAGVNELAAENEALGAERTLLDERVSELQATLDTRVHELTSENDQLKEQLRKLTERMDTLELGGGSCAR